MPTSKSVIVNVVVVEGSLPPVPVLVVMIRPVPELALELPPVPVVAPLVVVELLPLVAVVIGFSPESVVPPQAAMNTPNNAKHKLFMTTAPW
jgi:hypothetical protein